MPQVDQQPGALDAELGTELRIPSIFNDARRAERNQEAEIRIPNEEPRRLGRFSSE